MNRNEPAYPSADSRRYQGLTRRELFAAMAMQGLFANSEYEGNFEESAQCSVQMADALLKELGK